MGVEKLLEEGFWSSVAVVVDNFSIKSDVVGKYLAEMAAWPEEYSSFIVKILGSVECWSRLGKVDSENLLRRMVEFLPHLKSLPHFTAFVKIANDHLSRFAIIFQTYRILFFHLLLSNYIFLCNTQFLTILVV